jgi:quercetin dioxygenase-like cupin family protein
MRTASRRRLGLAGAATTLALAGATAALATAPSGETLTPIARGTLIAPINVNRAVTGGRVRIKTRGNLDMLMASITLAPGGSSGWHEHAGTVMTIVTQGTLTEIDGKCRRHDLSAGQADIEPGGAVGNAENRGSTPVVFDVVFLIPHGTLIPRIDEPAPAGCNA